MVFDDTVNYGLRTLYLIRHGQYDTSDRHEDGGYLTEHGEQQAAYTARAIVNVPITQIISSTMRRAIQTAEIMANEMQYSDDLIQTPLIREAIPTIPPRLMNEIMVMMERDPNLTHERIHQDQQRADEAFEALFIPPNMNQDHHDVLVCHGNIIRYLVCKALGINVDTWAKMDIFHCSLTTITIDGQGRMRLVTYNEIAHIPPQAVTQ